MRYFLALLFLSAPAYAENFQCAGLFFDREIESAIYSLAELRLSLDLARASNSNSIAHVALEGDFRKKEKFLETFLKESDIQKLIQIQIAKIQILIREPRPSEIEKRNQGEEKIKSMDPDGNLGIFHYIGAGEAIINRFTINNTIEVTKGFEMMATSVTQVLWSNIVRLIQTKLPGKYNLKENPSEIQNPLAPVNNVSYDDAENWIAGLNELSMMNEPELEKIFVDHKSGIKYRLPSGAEWEFVAHGRGTVTTNFYWGNEFFWKEDYIYPRSTSDISNFPVAKKVPLTFEGKSFYDLWGNVYEWVTDDFSGWKNMKVFKGGIFTGGTSGVKRSEPRGNIGLRLVREVRAP